MWNISLFSSIYWVCSLSVIQLGSWVLVFFFLFIYSIFISGAQQHLQYNLFFFWTVILIILRSTGIAFSSSILKHVMHAFIEKILKCMKISNCVWCLDWKLKMITLFHHSTERERARGIQNFINCCNVTLQATCTSKNLQWSRWIDEYAIKDFENVCFKNKPLSKSLTIQAYNLQKCHCSFFSCILPTFENISSLGVGYRDNIFTSSDCSRFETIFMSEEVW